MFGPKMVDLFGVSLWKGKAATPEFLFQDSQSLLPKDSLLRSSSFADFLHGGDCFSTSNVKHFSVRLLNILSSLSLWSGCFSIERELNATCRIRLAGVFLSSMFTSLVGYFSMPYSVSLLVVTIWFPMASPCIRLSTVFYHVLKPWLVYDFCE